MQSALDPASDDASVLAGLTWLLFGGASAIFALVMALLAVASLRPGGWLGSRRTIVIGGIVFPIVTLSALFPYGLTILRDTNVARPDALRIAVTGEQYWWRVRYEEDGPGRPAFATANEIRVPVGRPLSFALASADVIHSFWIPSLAGKRDMIPGRVNEVHFTVDRPGTYRGVCTEFCGAQHAYMAFYLVAMEAGAFDEWRRQQSGPARPAGSDELRRGEALFISGGCGSCHAVRGLARAEGRLGPDLTHLGTRMSLGAGVFPNNVGTIAGWISNVQQIKGGARMPSYGALSGPDLRALSAYLASLR